MNLDMDLGRDRAAAFGPSSAATGALLPYEGRAVLRSPEWSPADALEIGHDSWLSPNNPILVRGLARVLPLAWHGEGSGAAPDEVAGLATQMQDAGMYRAGKWRVLDDLAEHRGDSIASYVTALRAAGATRANFWTYSETVGVALVWVGDDDAVTTLALHVVPVAWVSERHVKKPVRGIDVRWSWADVVELYVATGSVAGVKEEGQGR